MPPGVNAISPVTKGRLARRFKNWWPEARGEAKLVMERKRKEGRVRATPGKEKPYGGGGGGGGGFCWLFGFASKAKPRRSRWDGKVVLQNEPRSLGGGAATGRKENYHELVEKKGKIFTTKGWSGGKDCGTKAKKRKRPWTGGVIDKKQHWDGNVLFTSWGTKKKRAYRRTVKG